MVKCLFISRVLPVGKDLIVPHQRSVGDAVLLFKLLLHLFLLLLSVLQFCQQSCDVTSLPWHLFNVLRWIRFDRVPLFFISATISSYSWRWRCASSSDLAGRLLRKTRELLEPSFLTLIVCTNKLVMKILESLVYGSTDNLTFHWSFILHKDLETWRHSSGEIQYSLCC